MTGMDAATGRKITGKEHIQQSIADILLTPVGTRIQRRDYGSMLPELIDQPLDDALVLQMMAASVIAITKWEPRVRIDQIQFDITQLGSAALHLDVIRLDTGMPDALNIPLAGGAV